MPITARILLGIVLAFALYAVPIFASADVTIDASINNTNTVRGTYFKTTVFTTNLTGYTFYVDSSSACVYSKTTDGGYTWGAAVTVKTATCIGFDIWYDQWTPGDTSGTKIHIVTLTSTDLFYTELDTSSDTVSTAVDASTGASQTNLTAANNTYPTITKATNGTLYLGTVDNSDQYILRCTATCTTGSNWSETGTNPLGLLNAAGNDSIFLVPLASDDVMVIGQDLSANDVLSKVWSNGGSAWSVSWTTIDGAATTSGGFGPYFTATLNKSTNTIYLLYAADLHTPGTGDLRSSSYSGGTWTRSSDVFTNLNTPINTFFTGSSAAYDETNNVLYAGYTKATTTPDNVTANGHDQVFYRKSADGGNTWSEEFGPFASNPPTGFSQNYGFSLNYMSPYKIFATWNHNVNADLYGAILESRLSFNTESNLTFTGNVKFNGNLSITGALAKGSGTFVIDHPLKPFTHLLYHSFVESPEPKNMYDGVATLDARGEARITLPDYFEALNKDFRYQFFPHFQPMPNLYVKEEVKRNTFVIAGGVPGGEITWQITGNRHDPYILANPIIPEVQKDPTQPVDQGECLFEILCL